MNIGTGIDIVEKKRIEKIYLSYGMKLLKKILHKDEILEVKNFNDLKIISFLSNRFSVKEAISKAIGGGINNHYLSFKDIVIKKNQHNRPCVEINQKIFDAILFFNQDLLQKKGYEISNIKLENLNFLISISDEVHYSCSSAILELL